MREKHGANHLRLMLQLTGTWQSVLEVLVRHCRVQEANTSSAFVWRAASQHG